MKYSNKKRIFDAFVYLIQEFEVKEFVLNERPSRKFVEKIKFPFFDSNSLCLFYNDWIIEYINEIQLKQRYIC